MSGSDDWIHFQSVSTNGLFCRMRFTGCRDLCYFCGAEQTLMYLQITTCPRERFYLCEQCAHRRLDSDYIPLEAAKGAFV